jgi:hypothetical protein
MKLILLTVGVARVQADAVSCGQPCFLAPDNTWKPEDLQPYFVCLQTCCEDYDPSRLFDGTTCEDIVGYAADMGLRS